ncbi:MULTISPECIES: FUSC family protein [unclassified Actinotalea]|uniref:FUSC family protein n=1 Tax=unclassified Actinotalea TaxID=2638618 RepID=UPI0015F44942|nr:MULTISPECIES: FUSC family protein [unclassified Actinotalea]
METIWLVLGVVVLAATLVDVFLTALNYDEAGYLAGRVASWQWRALRRVTRRLPRRWRPLALRQVTGLQLIATIVVWLFGVITGFGLIYLGQMTRGAFSVTGTGARLDLFDALYFSAAQLATVGGSALTAETDVLRFLSIAESLTGVLLLSLVLTFLLGVYDVIGDLNALCQQFVPAERGAGSAVATLAPYIRGEEVQGLDGHLDGVAGALGSYVSGLRLHHAAYYFQSGQDRFALPYALRMVGDTLGALRWGLPSGHPATSEPALVPLTFQLLELGDYLQRRHGWRSEAVPSVVTAEEFARQVRADLPRRPDDDAWVARFVHVDRDMARLAGVEPLADVDDAYRRYSAWLPFAYRTQQTTLAVSTDLDYRPMIVSDEPVSILHGEGSLALRRLEGDDALPSAAPPPAPPGPRGRLSRWQAFVDEHVAQVDPGYVRLRAASRAVLAAVLGAASLALVFRATDVTGATSAAIFGGFVGMLGTGVSAGRTRRARQMTSLLLLVPVGLVVVLGALASGSRLLTAVLLVGVALVGVWVGRFGPRWAALGRIAFLVYYFALILRLELADAPLYAAAAVTGVLWAYVISHVVLPDRPRQTLQAGIDGLGLHLVASMGTLVDAVSSGRWDPDIGRRVAVDTRRLHRTAAFLAGTLASDEEAGVDPVRSAELRLRLFDLELASVNLTMAARAVTGTAYSLEMRGRLAGRLALLQAHLAATTGRAGIPGAAPSGPPPNLEPWPAGPAPATWPGPARALHEAAEELYRATDRLHGAEEAALAGTAPPRPDVDLDVDDGALLELERATAGPPEPAEGRGMAPTTRRALQAAVATGVALAAGELVSTTHQYWATLAAYQVLGGTDGETFVKGAQRVAGTVAGAVVGFTIALSTGSDPAVLFPVLVVAAFASTYYRPVSQAVSTFWATMIFAMIYEFLGRLTTLAIEIRVLETLFGAVVALLVAWWVFPTRTRTKLNADAGRLAADVETVVLGSLERMAGNEAISRAAIDDRLLVVNQDVRSVTSTAAPLRRSAGALEAGGVEAQLTTVWALTSHTRHLARAVQYAVGVGTELTPQEWRGLRDVTSQNFAALRDTLADRLPGPLREDLGLERRDASGGPAARTDDLVLHELERINQTVTLLVSMVSPGAGAGAAPADAAAR